MDKLKIKKIKDQLEKILDKTIKDSASQGIDINSQDFKAKIANIRKKILQRLNISEGEYGSIEEFIQQQREEIDKTDVDKDIFLAMQEVSREKIVNKTPKELMGLKIRLSKLENKSPNWKEIVGKPNHVLSPFDQRQIKNLDFSQLRHTDEDHKGLSFRMNKSSIDTRETIIRLETDIEKAKDELRKEIFGIKINHSDLMGIMPDDHHPEKHTLESHKESEWQEKFKRMISGGRVDDLHTHAFPLSHPYLGEPWGITKGDADSYYLRLDGTTTPTANIGFGGYKITDLGTPTADSDACTKKYADDLIAGENWWQRAGTTISPENAGDSLDMGAGTISGVNVTSGIDPGHTHSIYLTAETDPVFSAWLAVPPNISIFNNDSGFITSWGPETDPVFGAWLAGPPNVSIFTNDAGYLAAESDPVFTAWSVYTGWPANASGVLTNDGAGNLSWGAGGGGYTNLTQFVDQTAWMIFYSNTDGDVTELAFGDSGKVFTSNGASAAPTWETPSASVAWGDVTGTLSDQTDLQNALDAKLNDDSYTKLLLHFNGLNSSTLFVDSSSSKHAVTPTSTTISTAQQEFGTSSGLFGVNSQLAIADSPDWNISGDFTIDFWIYFTALSGDTSVMRDTTSGDQKFRIWWTSNSWQLIFDTGGWGVNDTPATDTWIHYALVRTGTTNKFFKNGTQIGNDYTNSDSFDWGGVWIGKDTGTSISSFQGYLDEFRISNGIARWTSNFSVPTSPYRAYFIDYEYDVSQYFTNWLSNDIDFGAVDLTTTGSISGGTLTDETLSINLGNITGMVSATDGTASWSSSSLSGFTSVSATTLTDGTFSMSLGAGTGLVSLTDGTASWSASSLSGFTSVSATTLTDGIFSVSAGAVTGATGNISMWTNDSGYLTSAADTALSNLGSVAINTDLISDTASTDSLGSSSIPWLNVYAGSLYLFESGASPTYYTILQGPDITGGANVTFILPDGLPAANAFLKVTSGGQMFEELDIILNDNGTIKLDSTPDNVSASGTKADGVLGETVTVGQILGMTSTDYMLANATATTEVRGMVLALEGGDDDDTIEVLHEGYYTNTGWSWTQGGVLYLSTSDGTMTQTPPSASGNFVQILGWAVSATIIYFRPQLNIVEIT